MDEIKKLELMIKENCNLKDILKQSEKIDDLVNQKIKGIR